MGTLAGKFKIVLKDRFIGKAKPVIMVEKRVERWCQWTYTHEGSFLVWEKATPHDLVKLKINEVEFPSI